MKTLRLLLASSGALFAVAAVFAAEPKKYPVTATHTVANPNYVRVKLPNGSFQPETYAFGKGEFLSGRVKDPSIDDLQFNDIARVLARPLASQGYVPSHTAPDTRLLIVVNWGTTIPHDSGQYRAGLDALSSAMNSRPMQSSPASGGPADFGAAAQRGQLDAAIQAEADGEMTSMLMMQDQLNRIRDQANVRNARLLGYAPALANLDGAIGPLDSIRRDLVDEIEDDRYFVILIAYDFQDLWKTKKRTIQWITRFSIRARGQRFDEQLGNMARLASTHFGRATDSLVHNNRPERVEIGEPEFIRFEEKK